ncbi:hypothetical protein J6590_014169 [Homalodisca vitripennis]|nr:hypothetical protein J6590_014169 [Homalodisca vitripennis]
MTLEEENYLRKTENLLQKLSEMEVQLGNQKQLNLDIQCTFEEHDRKREQIINELALKNRELEKSMSLVRREGHCSTSSPQAYIDTDGTQTTPSSDQLSINVPPTGPLLSLSALVLDIGQLKTGQEQLEHAVKECTVKLLGQGHPATVNNGNNSSGAPPTLVHVGMTPSRILCTTSRKNKHKAIKGKSHFSVSLQEHSNLLQTQDHDHTMEEIEEIFDKNIEFYKQTIISSHPSVTITECNSSNQEEAPFLVLTTSKKGLISKSNRLLHLAELKKPNVIILTEHGLRQNQIESIQWLPGFGLVSHYSRIIN